jgi:PAS domain S-box-containing protein
MKVARTGIFSPDRITANTWAEANCQAVLEAAPDAMLVVNQAGEVVAANPQAGKLYGCGCEQLIGRVVESLIPVRFRDRHQHHRTSFFCDPRARPMATGSELFALRDDGTEVPVDVSLSPLVTESGIFVISAIRDATERLRAEELKAGEAILHQSEARFRSVADTAPVLIWMSGTDKLCTYFNKPWLDFTGRSIDEELGNGWAEGVHPEDLQRCLDTYAQSFDGRVKFRMEYRLRHHDGEYRWILDVGVPRFNADGSFAGYIGIGVDVSGRKRAEEALRESEERHRHLVESANDWVWEVDANVVYTYVGPQCRKVLGYEAEEIIGKTPFDLMPPEEARRVAAVFAPIAAERKPFRGLENINRHKDGHLVSLETNGVPVINREGEFLGYRGMDRDITERKRAEEALRESEERFRLVANNAPVMIWMSGLDTKPTYFNQLWLDFTGLSETDLLNGLAGIVHPEDSLQCHDVYCRGFDQRQPFRKECRLRRHDGQYRWMLDVGVPRFHKDGSFAGYIGSCIDVTEQKRAQEAISDMTQKLVEAQEQERTRIARELHDDIGQRLALLAIEMEQLHQDPLIVRKVRRRMGKLQEQISRIAADIQSLSHELHSARLQYLGIAAAMKGFCQEFGEQQKVKIHFKTHDLPSPLSPDISLCLFRVLQEALHNSAKHSGVRQFDVQLWGTSGEIQLTVKDSGAGFEREAAKGSRGLGLISMEERLKLVNGRLSIDSQPKRGTTIRARVPLRSESDSMRVAG